MHIELVHGDLLAADVDALVNTVNCEGVMGAGLALQFKQRFPDVFEAYRKAWRSGEVAVGRVHVVERRGAPPFVFNFPTKTHWRLPSKLRYVKDGLIDLVEQVRRRSIRSIAIPPLGCGLGGLEWADVEPLVRKAFEPLPEVRVLLFAPEGT